MTVTDTLGFLAYGMHPSPLGLDRDHARWLVASSAYTSMSWELQMAAAHADCHISAFCRNPLHPGPCKGWKHHLGLVSPGALHALEKARYEKLEERRKSKVAALLAQGKKVPASLQKPIVYDPAKNPHITNPDKITPGLGIPTPGLTPEAAQKTLEKIPTKAQVAEKLAAKHAVEAKKINVGDAVKHKNSWNHHIVVAHNPDGTTTLEHAGTPGKGITKVNTADLEKLTGEDAEKALAAHENAKLAGAPTMLTISKAGLKDGDKVFLHGVINGGAPTLVTVRKKPKGYQFVDDKGNVVHSGGGASTKWALSPAPGKEFPKHDAASQAGPSGFEKGEQTKLDSLLNGNQGASAVKAHEKAQTIVTAIALAGGKHASYDQQQQMIATIHHNDSLPDGHPGKKKAVMSDQQVTKLADAIGFKVASKIGPGDSGGLTAPDFTDALHKELSHAIENGGDTPLLDAASDVTKMFGSEPGSQEKFVQLAKNILGKDTGEPAKPKIEANPDKSGAEVKAAIATAYEKALQKSGSKQWVELASLRKEMEHEGIPKSDVDKALKELSVTPGVTVVPESNQKALTPEQVAAAVTIGNQQKHLIHMEPADIATHKGGADKPMVPSAGKAQADAFHEPIGSPNAGAAPHVKQAIAYANGHQAATDTKKLEAYQKLTHEELASLDPNTQKLMAANLDAMNKKFLDPKKKSVVADLKSKLSVAQGGGAGAGGTSATASPAAVPSAAVTPGGVIKKLAEHAGASPDLHMAAGAPGSHNYVSAELAVKKTDNVLGALHLPSGLHAQLDNGVGTPLELALKSDYLEALSTSSTKPGGVAGKVDDVIESVNADATALAKKNGWAEDSPAVQQWKTAVAEQEIKKLIAAHTGTSSSVPTPAASAVHSPAAPAAPSVPASSAGAPSKPYTAPTAGPIKTEKGAILLKHAQQLKIVKAMKSFPEGQYLESPEPKIWDNLVALAAHEGVTPMQILETVDTQNAKKLGLENKKLLESKIRNWLGTADGKAYSGANSVPKAHLESHLKATQGAHTNFVNKTGINLPPGEKVQKLGGPGEFEENVPAGKFGKHDVATAEADQNKFKAENGIKFSSKQIAALTEYVNGSGAINGWLRDEHTPSQKSIDNAIYLQSMMLPTQRDHYLLRGTGWTQFPPEARSYEGLQKLVGETLEEPAFLSASVSKSSSGFGGAVKMHIEAPKGTMGVFTKDDQYHSQYLGSEAELLLAARTELKVLKVWKEGGQVQVLMRVVS